MPLGEEDSKTGGKGIINLVFYVKKHILVPLRQRKLKYKEKACTYGHRNASILFILVVTLPHPRIFWGFNSSPLTLAFEFCDLVHRSELPWPCFFTPSIFWLKVENHSFKMHSLYSPVRVRDWIQYFKQVSLYSPFTNNFLNVVLKVFTHLTFLSSVIG